MTVVADEADHVVQFVVAHDAVAPRRVFRVDELFEFDDERVLFVDLMFVGQIVIVVDPVRDAREAAGVVDGDAGGPSEDLGRIEDVVDLGVLEHGCPRGWR